MLLQDKDEEAAVETEATPKEEAAAKEEIKENGVSESEEPKTPEAEAKETAGGDQPMESSVEKTPEGGDNKIEETPDSKKKDKSKKKKWSFRSISFSKKDKSKPNKDADKNGDVKEVAEEVRAESTLRCRGGGKSSENRERHMTRIVIHRMQDVSVAVVNYNVGTNAGGMIDGNGGPVVCASVCRV